MTAVEIVTAAVGTVTAGFIGWQAYETRRAAQQTGTSVQLTREALTISEESLRAARQLSAEQVRTRLDARGRYEHPFPGFASAAWDLAYARYEHTEFEGDEAGTVFEQDAVEGRAELAHGRWGCVEGAVGLQASFTDLVVMAGYTALAARVLSLLRSPRQIAMLNKVFGSLFVAAGALLALFKRA